MAKRKKKIPRRQLAEELLIGMAKAPFSLLAFGVNEVTKTGIKVGDELGYMATGVKPNQPKRKR